MVEEILFEASLVVTNDDPYKKDEKYINGLPNFKLKLREHIGADSSDMIHFIRHGPDELELNLFNFRPGSVVALKYGFILLTF